MRLKLQRHHIAQLLESSQLVTTPGHRALLDGDHIHADLDFLTRFANFVREVELLEPGQHPTPKKETMSLPAIEALQMIRFSGWNEHPTSVWMQKWAAWGMEPSKWPKPQDTPPQKGGE
jgi:hypothetical protein